MSDVISQFDSLLKRITGKPMHVGVQLYHYHSVEDDEPRKLEDYNIISNKVMVSRIGAYTSCELLPDMIDEEIPDVEDISKVLNSITRYAPKANDEDPYNLVLSIMPKLDDDIDEQVNAIILVNPIYWQVGLNSGLKILFEVDGLSFIENGNIVHIV